MKGDDIIFALSVALVAAIAPLLVSFGVGGWASKLLSPARSFEYIPDLTGKVAIVTGTLAAANY